MFLETLNPPPPNIGRRELESQGGKGQPPEGYSVQSRLLRLGRNQGVPPSWPLSARRRPGRRRQLGVCGSRISCLRLLRWVLCDQRERRGKLTRNQRSVRVGDELQEMLLSKNMPFLKGKQSLEGVRSPRGEESKTVRLTGRPGEQQRGPLPTHFPCD